MPLRRPFLHLATLAAGILAAAGVACARPAADPPATAIERTAQRSGTTALLIAVAAVDGDVAWASGARGTVIRTTNGGAEWLAMRVPGADSLQFRDIHAFDARTAWVLSIGNGDQSRIYRTDDGGANWTQQFRNADAKAFYDCIEMWDARRGLVIGDAIGTEMAILRTEDGGATWTKLAPAGLPTALEGEGSFAASGTCIAMRPEGRAWIIMNTPTTSRLIRTRDYGRTWAVETLPITTHEGSGAQSVLFTDDRRGMVLGGGYATKAGDTLIAVTDDGGDTWTPRAAPAFRVGTWGGAIVRRARGALTIAVGPSGSAWSGDRGASWTPLDTLNYWSVGAAVRAGTASASTVGTAWAVGTQGKVTRFVFR